MPSKSLFVIPAIIISLSGCIKAPTLEERLAGKTGAERQQELYGACLENTNYHNPSSSRLWALCDAMYNVNKTQEK